MIVKSTTGAVAVTENHVTAAFATTGVIDHDLDVIAPGAVAPGPVVISGWGHASWNAGAMSLPIGKGTINEVGDKLILAGEFFDTAVARETKATLAGLGDLGEWSWSLHDIEGEPETIAGQRVRRITKVRVREVSPVLSAASIGTGTIALRGLLTATEKAELRAIAARHTTPATTRAEALAVARRWGLR